MMYLLTNTLLDNPPQNRGNAMKILVIGAENNSAIVKSLVSAGHMAFSSGDRALEEVHELIIRMTTPDCYFVVLGSLGPLDRLGFVSSLDTEKRVVLLAYDGITAEKTRDVMMAFREARGTLNNSDLIFINEFFDDKQKLESALSGNPIPEEA